MMKTKLTFAAIVFVNFLSSIFGATRASADITINMQESGSDVIFSYSGSLDISGLDSPVTVGDLNSGVNPSLAALAVEGSLFDLYADVLSGPASFGPGGPHFLQGAGQGDPFFFGQSFGGTFEAAFAVPAGYTSGASISGSFLLTSTDFSTLGIDVASAPYVWAINNTAGDTITLAAVPEPSTFATCMLFASLAAFRRKRR